MVRTSSSDFFRDAFVRRLGLSDDDVVVDFPEREMKESKQD